MFSIAVAIVSLIQTPPAAAGGVEATSSPPTPPNPAPLRLVVRTDQPKHEVPGSLWGAFFEEINHAGEGGILAELLRNRSFTEPPTSELVADGAHRIDVTPGWTRGDGAILDLAEPRSAASAGAVRLHGAMENRGHFGIVVRGGERYTLRLDAKRLGEASIVVRLESADGVSLAESPLALDEAWSSQLAELAPTQSSDSARLVVRTEGPGDAIIDLLSLTPKSTWRGHGLRNDLAELVAAMRPAFLRFPGGCYVEGGDLLKDAFRWPATVGDIAERPGHANANWGYWSTDGLGFHEYLQWCEDLGAEPIFVVNCGLSHREVVPMEALGPWIQEALDAIEYANGAQGTPQGSRRANNGHPAPFGLKLIEIGNENGLFGGFGGTREQYAERYRAFAEAITARAPEIKLISNVPLEAHAGGSATSPPAPLRIDFVDDHFYNSPAWFWQNVGLYDRVERGNRPLVFVGEYAVTSRCGLGNLDAALAEAAFMTGLERNSDLVRMACYAPLFVHARDRKWNPDLIVFDAGRSYGTPSYWVQVLFAEHRVERLLPVDLPSLPLEQPAGTIGLGSWKTHAEYTDVRVSIGSTAIEPSAQSGMRPVRGKWSWERGTYRIGEEGEEQLMILDVPELREASEYVLTLKARKIAGSEGFLIAFHADRSLPDGERLTWWNIGGWNNTAHAIERTDGGRMRLGAGVAGSIETDRWYEIRIETAGGRARCFLDGVLVHDLDTRVAPRVAAAAGSVGPASEIVVKIVNGGEVELPLLIEVPGLDRIARAEVAILTGPSLAAENTCEAPTAVSPKRTTLPPGALPLPFVCPPRSLSVLRLVPAGR